MKFSLRISSENLTKSAGDCGFLKKSLMENFIFCAVVFPLINAWPQISAAPLGIHFEISASLLINAALLNTALVRIVTIFCYKLNQNAYGLSMEAIKQ